jgi:exodeoxyribonuclease VII small subunit
MSKISFEKNLLDLEQLVEKMSSGKLSLDESLANFEKSVDLYKKCKSSLENAEKKIKILTEDLKEEDF